MAMLPMKLKLLRNIAPKKFNDVALGLPMDLTTKLMKLKMDEIKTKFEQWMQNNFDEPEWDEGWNRANMEYAFRCGAAQTIGQVGVRVMPKIADTIEKETKDYCQKSYWTSKYFADEEQCNEILQNQIKLFSRFIIETLNSNFTA